MVQPHEVPGAKMVWLKVACNVTPTYFDQELSYFPAINIEGLFSVEILFLSINYCNIRKKITAEDKPE